MKTPLAPKDAPLTDFLARWQIDALLASGWLLEVKAEVWDEAYEYFGDMLAMPHPSNNPYRRAS